VPGAVAGEGGHGHTLYAAVTLVRGFLLSRDEARSLILEWNKTCVPEWDANAIEHKLDEAEKIACSKPDGWMIEERTTQRGSCWDNVDFNDNP
jgi:hypothetical protein